MSSSSVKIFQNFSLEKFFDKAVQAFLIFLPWSTLVSVFLVYKIWIPGGNFLKEIILFSILASLGILLYKKFQKTHKNPLNIDKLTIIILAYIIIMLVITIFTTGIRGLVFGGRYDFIFLIVFLIFYHGSVFLKKSPFYYLKLFLASAAIMIFLSGLLKFPFQEEILVFFGYSEYISAWDFGGAPPIFHGIEGANVRRFQGILDGPNAMAAFLLVFIGMLIYYFHDKKDWYFFVGVIVVGIVAMIFYTYSRSSIIGLIGGSAVALAWGLGFLWKNYKKQLFALILIALGFVWILMVKYSGSTQSLIGREGSTKGHAERMLVGVNRFLDHPMGQGMGSSGPAYRHVLKLQNDGREAVEEQDRYYIPESWYIQQFVEGGIFGGILFLVISAWIFFSLFSIHSVLAGTFAAIGVMNLFLHTYESSVVSFTLFAIIGMILGYHKFSQKNKK